MLLGARALEGRTWEQAVRGHEAGLARGPVDMGASRAACCGLGPWARGPGTQEQASQALQLLGASCLQWNMGRGRVEGGAFSTKELARVGGSINCGPARGLNSGGVCSTACAIP